MSCAFSFWMYWGDWRIFYTGNEYLLFFGQILWYDVEKQKRRWRYAALAAGQGLDSQPG